MGIHFTFTHKDARKLVISLILFEVFLAVVYLIEIERISWTIGSMFNLDGETTIPAWFSSMQLLLIGILFLSSGSWPQRHLIVFPHFLFIVGIGFIFLSMDEAATIHEKINHILKSIEWIPSFKGGHGIWILVYLSIAIALSVIGGRTIISFFKVYSRYAVIMLLGATIFLIGAVGLEIISYQYLRVAEHSHIYKLEVALEELFEMAGASIILYGTILCAHSEHSTR